MDVTAVVTIGSVLAGIAAATHVYIWVLESVLWMRPSTRRTFAPSIVLSLFLVLIYIPSRGQTEKEACQLV